MSDRTPLEELQQADVEHNRLLMATKSQPTGHLFRSIAEAEVTARIARRYNNDGLREAVMLAAAYAHTTLDSIDLFQVVTAEAQRNAGVLWLKNHAAQIIHLLTAPVCAAIDQYGREAVLRDILGA